MSQGRFEIPFHTIAMPVFEKTDQQLEAYAQPISGLFGGGWEMSVRNALQGMTVQVTRVDLIERLNANREKHIQEFQDAIAGWKLECVSILNQQIARFELVGWETTQPDPVPQRPRNFLDSYDDAIDMFHMEQRGEITLTGAQFKAFMRDDWDWKDAHRGQVMRFSQGM